METRRFIKPSTNGVARELPPSQSAQAGSFPKKPQDTLSKNIYQQLIKFVEQQSVDRLSFPEKLTKDERKAVHELAEAFGLVHYSTGKTNARKITVEKVDPLRCYLEAGHFLGLYGEPINRWADWDSDSVPQAQRLARFRRDGSNHHITLLTKDELQQVSRQLPSIVQKRSQSNSNNELVLPFSEEEFHEQYKQSKSNPIQLVLQVLAENIHDDWTDLGLGKVTEGKNMAFFKVIDWPSAQSVRSALGLPRKDFHITVGFLFGDIHSKSKDQHSIVIPTTPVSAKTSSKDHADNNNSYQPVISDSDSDE